MTTPTSNSVGISIFDPYSLGDGRYVGYGQKWGGELGTGVTLTYSFINPNSYYQTDYSGYNEYKDSYLLNTGEQNAVRLALAIWSSFANISFYEATDSASVAGDLRYGYSTLNGGGEAAHAYLPSSEPSGGDVWFDLHNFNSNNLPSIAIGSDDFHTILHETGHALGLKHSFELPNAASAAYDNYFYTVMSYTASPWSAHQDGYASFYPTTPMYFDLLAIERMYGQRAHNGGNTTYTFLDGRMYWQAINDTGGRDTIIYRGAQNTTIDLNPGHFSSLSESISFRAPNGSPVSSRDTVTIGPNVVIENATGGNGSDTLVGNRAANVLTGGLGNDTLRGFGGNDTLAGGLGNDRLYGGANNDIFRFDKRPDTSSNHDNVYDYSVAQDTIRLENAVFKTLGAAGGLKPEYFRPAAHAVDGDDYIIYSRRTGKLLYDDNGSAAGHEVLVATFTTKPALTYHEFLVV
jgi:serralysin